ncbi:MAG: DUF2924 domain-containing protein [Acidobacteria bacterium]|nr:DUF2924 domain-containing protein [Acidobacteriota bacterium]
MIETTTNIPREVAALKQMTVKELRSRYLEVFGEAARSGNKDWLWKRIAWRMQANVDGDLTERARRRAEELANDADLRMRRPPDPPAPSPASTTRTAKVAFGDRAGQPMPGTILTRQYKGQMIQVTVLDNGFEYLGAAYGSLSAVAKTITGSHWNGNYFFGLGAGRKSHG